MKSFFRPEFINRLDEMVVFRSLTKDDVRAIAEVEFRNVLARLGERDLDVTLTQAFKDKVVELGYDPAMGARPLRRATSNMLEETLAEYLLEAAGEEEDEEEEKARDSEAEDESQDAPAVRQAVVVDVDGATGKATVLSKENSMAA